MMGLEMIWCDDSEMMTHYMSSAHDYMSKDAHAYIVCTCLFFRVRLLVVWVGFLLWIEDESLSISETGEGVWRNPLHLQQIVFQVERSQGGVRITGVAHSPLPQYPENTARKQFRHTAMCILHHKVHIYGFELKVLTIIGWTDMKFVSRGPNSRDGSGMPPKKSQLSHHHALSQQNWETYQRIVWLHWCKRRADIQIHDSFKQLSTFACKLFL